MPASARNPVHDRGASVNAKPQRVALVAASLAILGGQGVQAHALVTRLGAEGYEVDFIPINPQFPRRLAWVRNLPYARTLLNQVLYLFSLLAVRRADVVHIFSASYWSFLLAPVPAIWMARMFGKYVVLHYHSGEAEDHLSRWGRLIHPSLRMADKIVVPSHYLQEIFMRFGHRSEVVENVVDTRRFIYRERTPLLPRLLSIRNLEPHYRIDTIIEAFALLKVRYPEATLTVAGYGSQAAWLRSLAHTKRVTGIRFIGRVEPPAVPAVYDEAHIFVNAAIIDNQPVSVLEAFAAGLPVVSTPTGDIAAMLRHGKAGLIVPPDDSQAMADAIANLLEHPENTIQMTRYARDEVERYTWPYIRGKWAALYRNAEP